MNRLFATSWALGLACLGLANSAQAFSYSPPSTSFFASGSGFLANKQTSIKCDISIKGQTSKKGNAKITNVVFSGTNAACANTAATGLPWQVKALSLGNGKIMNFAFTGAFLGACGPGNVPITVSGSGVWTYTTASVPGGCTVGGTLPTVPAMTIVP